MPEGCRVVDGGLLGGPVWGWKRTPPHGGIIPVGFRVGVADGSGTGLTSSTETMTNTNLMNNIDIFIFSILYLRREIDL